MAVFEAGITLFPENAFLLMRLAEVELARGNPQDARRVFERTLAAQPLNHTARVQLQKLGRRCLIVPYWHVGAAMVLRLHVLGTTRRTAAIECDRAAWSAAE
jgi:hypothetical protein